MSQAAPGWYDDPGAPGRLRYWDGTAWTSHVVERTLETRAPEPPTPPVAQDPRRRRPTPVSSTGEPLAPWWRRLLARIIDDLICAVICLPFVIPILSTRREELLDWWNLAQQAARTDQVMPLPPSSVLTAIGAVGTVSVLVYFLFELIGLARFATTPGRIALGIAVREVGRTGPIGLQAASWRSGVKVLGQLLSSGTGLLANVGLFVTLVDLGRGVMDPKRRTVHDIVGKTEVVRGPTARRRSTAASVR